DLGGVAILARLVLPLAGAQAALDVELRTLAQVLAGDLRELPEEHHAVPFGALLLLAGLFVLPGLGGGQRDVGDGVAAGGVARIRVGAAVADQDDFVDSASHGPSFLWMRS